MKVLDLFSGIGGFSLGLEACGMETVAFCEADENARKVLRKNWPSVPIFPDVKQLSKEVLDDAGLKDIRLICGGYPCQPFSVAGKRGGSEDDRHLWPEMFRIIKEVRPDWVIGENVVGHVSMGIDEVLTDLESEGYTATPFIIPACAVDAPHRRDRVWIIAHADSDSESKHSFNEEQGRRQLVGHATRERFTEGGEPVERTGSQDFTNESDTNTWREFSGSSTPLAYTYARLRYGAVNEIQARRDSAYFSCENVANPESERVQRGRADRQQESLAHAQQKISLRSSAGGRGHHWPAEPSIRRVAHGVPNRSHRLKQLGNAVVPQLVAAIGHCIIQVEQASR